MQINNLPGQSEITYRIGTYSKFKKSMLVRLSSNEILSKRLTTRDKSNDLAIAFLDAGAIVLDVLTFYNERIANEGFIRTAKEQRSILELARAIGYELRPGVAASTYLAFSLETALGPVEKSVIDIGIKVQSLPSSGSEMPQTFETIESIEARPEWNNLKPKSTEPQQVNEYSDTIYLQSINTGLSPGDGILIVMGKSSGISGPDGSGNLFRVVEKVEPIPEKQITKVRLLGAKSEPSGVIIVGGSTSIADKIGPNINSMTNLFSSPNLLDVNEDQKKIMASSSWKMSDIAYVAKKNGLDTDEVLSILDEWSASALKVQLASTGTRVYSFRTKAAIFGSNAPSYKSLPESLVVNYPDWDSPETLMINKKRVFGSEPGKFSDEYYDGSKGKLVYLDNAYPSILPSSGANDSWIVFKSSRPKYSVLACKIQDVIEENILGFSLNSRVTGLYLDISDGSALSDFLFRSTTVFVGSEELQLADIPITDPIKDNIIVLDKKEANLKVGQLLAITGEVIDTSGQSSRVIRSEIPVIDEITVDSYARTIIRFKEYLRYSYRRDTIIINANVVRANHGESKMATLGGGDPSQILQSFLLREKPLTFVSAPTETGIKSTLEVYVDNIRWDEASSLYNLHPEDKAFVARQNDDLYTRILFGDGVRGRLPNAGLENIKAKYRIGIGKEGLVKAGKISILLDRPTNVREVTNPLPSSGAAGQETADRARLHAPLNVMTLGRIVSLTDYESFASAFAGIGKAHATWVWNAEERIVYLTIASDSGETIDSKSDLYQNLTTAISKFKDPVAKFRIGSFITKSFNIEAGIVVSPEDVFEEVKRNIEDSLKSTFSFEARQFGQPVHISELFATIQAVEGVDAVDIDYLYLSGQARSNSIVEGKTGSIPSNVSHWDDVAKKIIPAELVILNDLPNGGGIIISKKELGK